MAALSNARRELFAQGLTKGLTAYQAYIEAGYKADRGAASRLSANVSIQARVAELQKRVEDRFELSRVEWLKSFLRIAQKAERVGDFAAARGALREIGLAMPRWYTPEEVSGAITVLVKRLWGVDKDAGANPANAE